jgi:hypothetical protein
MQAPIARSAQLPAPDRPRSVPALLLLLVPLTLVAGGCRLDTPETDRAQAQARKVLTGAGVPVTLVTVSVTSVSEGADTSVSEGADHLVTMHVVYDDGATSTDRAQVAETASRTIWLESIAEVDTIVVRAESTLETSDFTAPELERRLGARPPGLVQVDAATLAREQEEAAKGLLGVMLATMLPIMIGMVLSVVLMLVITVGVVVLIIVLVTRQSPPPPGPWGYGPGPGPGYRG